VEAKHGFDLCNKSSSIFITTIPTSIRHAIEIFENPESDRKWILAQEQVG
jgi:hypothetical protein